MIYEIIETVVKSFPNEYREMLGNISSTQKFKKNEFVLKQGKYCNHLWFITKGAVKAFEPFKGIERVTYFFLDNMFSPIRKNKPQTILF